MKGISNQFSSIEQVTNQYLNQQRISDSTNVSGKSFDEILKEKQNENSLELKFSKHASMRLSDRNITLTDEYLVEIFDNLGIEITKEIAECLMTGILTDTGGFQYFNVSDKTFNFASRVSKLINISDLYKNLYQQW